MTNKIKIPAFVSVVAFLLGCYDLIRGFMHTFNLENSALHIAKLNLASPEAADLLQLLGLFGVSNYITGMMLILIALRARDLALMMLLIIPCAYTIGIVEIKINSASYPASQAAWLGKGPMLIYLIICGCTFIAGIACVFFRWRSTQRSSSHSQRA
ncbi:MAG: hypothetical protein GW760_07420 [Legionella sp.]|jgi:hypothetical protein|nr:hypothetical protein [Legionella sp.]